MELTKMIEDLRNLKNENETLQGKIRSLELSKSKESTYTYTDNTFNVMSIRIGRTQAYAVQVLEFAKKYIDNPSEENKENLQKEINKLETFMEKKSVS